MSARVKLANERSFKKRKVQHTTDVVRFAEVVPGDDLDDVGPDLVDGLLPAVVPERVALLDPAVAVEVLELPGGYGYSVNFSHST